MVKKLKRRRVSFIPLRNNPRKLIQSYQSRVSRQENLRFKRTILIKTGIIRAHSAG
jgi:hypothetical protein